MLWYESICSVRAAQRVDYCFRNKMLGNEALGVQLFGINQKTNKYSATSKILVTIHWVK